MNPSGSDVAFVPIERNPRCRERDAATCKVRLPGNLDLHFSGQGTVNLPKTIKNMFLLGIYTSNTWKILQIKLKVAGYRNNVVAFVVNFI